VALLHGFCRLVDDAADECAGGAPELDRLAAELAGRAAARPIVARLLPRLPAMGLSRAPLELLLAGVRGDLAPVRMADDDALVRYCYQVSSTVGLMLCAALGVAREGWDRAVDLGVALQLSDVLADVAEDAARGRVYLPDSRLARAGLDAEAVLAGRGWDDRRLESVRADLAALADRYYASARQGLRWVPLRYRHGVLLLAEVWAAHGRAGLGARRRGGFVRLGPLGKAAALVRVAGRALTPEVLGLRPPAPRDPALHRPLAGWPGTAGAG
jgi:phytoene synthase